MIVFLFNIYLLLLFLLVHFKVVPFNLYWKLSPVLVFLLLNIGLFIPMGWGAPSGPLLLTRHSVQIVPDVAGQVIDVPIEPNVPIKENDVLFRIDPTPFKAQVDALDAQLKFAELRREQFTTLQRGDAGRAFDVQQRESEVQQLKAQLDGARWNLEKTTVRAPADGYVTNLALRKGARVANIPLSPVMAFIDTSESVIAAEIAQINARYIEPGQHVEVTFKMFPGHIYSGRVESVLQAISTGQVKPSGLAVTPSEVQSAPFVVRIALDDADVAKRLPAGSTGTAAIFTDHVNPRMSFAKSCCGCRPSSTTSIRSDAVIGYTAACTSVISEAAFSASPVAIMAMLKPDADFFAAVLSRVSSCASWSVGNVLPPAGRTSSAIEQVSSGKRVTTPSRPAHSIWPESRCSAS